MDVDQVDYEQVTEGLKSKSEKIRALSRHGVPTAEIARYLDIRYQHARNVLVEAGLHRPAAAAQEAPRHAWIELDSSGRLTIPAELLAAAGVLQGPSQVRVTEDGLEILSRKAALARARALLAPYVQTGRSVVDEFIADRHREAERE